MPEFVLNRTHALRSLTGHSINFIKGKPTWVPQIAVKEALEIGAEPVEAMDKTAAILGDDAPLEPIALTPEERTAAMEKAFDELAKLNQRNDFAGGGQPTVKAVVRVVGFEVDKKEIETAFVAYKQKKADAE